MDKQITNFTSEEEFLKAYNPNDYDRLSLTTDILVFSISNGIKENYRILQEKHFSVLLVKRDEYPFKGKWCLPGGFVGIDESADEAAERILKNETNLKDIYIEQLYTFSDVKRDPRMRVVSTAYMSLIDKNMLDMNIPENACWFNIKYEETEKIFKVTLDNGNEKIYFEVEKILRNKTTDRYSFKVKENEDLAFDHPLVIVSGIARLKNKIEYTDVVFNMMPEYFTLGELQQVYEIILGRKLIAPAFRRLVEDRVEKTNIIKKGEGHRPPLMYKYKEKK